MSTRGEVELVREGESTVHLYHTSDTYPSYMLPVIKRAYKIASDKLRENSQNQRKYVPYNAYRMVRPEHMASYVIAADPSFFIVDDCSRGAPPAHEEGSDLDWIYRLRADPSEKSEHEERVPKWELAVDCKIVWETGGGEEKEEDVPGMGRVKTRTLGQFHHEWVTLQDWTGLRGVSPSSDAKRLDELAEKEYARLSGQPAGSGGD
jgi:hypothetical protein